MANLLMIYKETAFRSPFLDLRREKAYFQNPDLCHDVELEELIERIGHTYKVCDDNGLKSCLVNFSLSTHNTNLPYMRGFEVRSVGFILLKCLDAEDRELRKIVIELLINLSHLEDKRYIMLLVGIGINKLLVSLANSADVSYVDSVFSLITNICCSIENIRQFFAASISAADVMNLIMELCESQRVDGLADYLWQVSPCFTESDSRAFCHFVIEMAVQHRAKLLLISGIFQALCVCSSSDSFRNIAAICGLVECLASLYLNQESEDSTRESVNEQNMLISVVVMGEIVQYHKEPRFLIDPLMRIIVSNNSSNRLVLAALRTITNLCTDKPECVEEALDRGLVERILEITPSKQSIFVCQVSACLAAIVCNSCGLVLSKVDDVFLLELLLETLSVLDTDVLVHLQATYLVLASLMSKRGVDVAKETFAMNDGHSVLLGVSGMSPDADATIASIMNLLEA